MSQTKMEKTRFWTFNQNNSGGHFDLDEEAGITAYVIIEAKTPDEASARAQDIGIYFDGVRDGVDCGCCGDRWSEPWDKGTAKPMVYSQPYNKSDSCRMPKGKNVCVHYLDGRKEWA